MEFSALVWKHGKKEPQIFDHQVQTPGPAVLINEYLRDIIKYVPDRTHGNAVMLRNGARFYIDLGSHPEYCTPETIEPRQTVLHELIGELIVAECLRMFIADNPRVKAASLIRGLSDMDGNFWSRHLNYSMLLENCSGNQLEQLAMSMNVHNATSRDMLGSGSVRPNGYDDDGNTKYRYSLGERIHCLSEDIGTGTTKNRPMFRYTNEALAAANKYRRIQFTGEDSPVSEWTMEMSVGTYALICEGFAQNKLRVIEPIPLGKASRAACDIAYGASFDLEGRRKYEFRINGDEDTHMYSTNEIQQMYIEDLERVEGISYKDRILDMWRDYANTRANGGRFVHNDTFVKLEYLQKSLARNGFEPREPGEMNIHGAKIDKSFGVVINATEEKANKYSIRDLLNQSPVGKLRNSKFRAYHIPDTEVDSGINNAPEETRAYERGRLIEEGIAKKMDWVSYSIEVEKMENGKTVLGTEKIDLGDTPFYGAKQS